MLLAGVALVALGGLLDTKPWAWPWDSIGSWIVHHAALIGAGLPGIAAVAVAIVAFRRTRAPNPAAARRPWLLSYPGITTAGAVVAILGIAALIAMLVLAGSSATEQAKLRIDAIKWGIGLFAAAGAVAALLLNVRRQQHAESAQSHTERDAAERRLTEIYTKAVEQLGHEQAAVRLGGLRALERVGQDNVKQRQIIIDVICAYLRMPFDPPASGTTGETAEPAEADADARQELEVRLTAEKIVTDHLRVPAGASAEDAARMVADPDHAFWPGIDVNLRRAVLMRSDFGRCCIGTADFREVTFAERVRFSRSRFTGIVRFSRATFSGDASFTGTTFLNDAVFHYAVFRAKARFGGADFRRRFWSQDVVFSGPASFARARFGQVALFARARFAEPARFEEAVFRRGAGFNEAAFSSRAVFGGATFSHSTTFDRATFGGEASFARASFAAGAGFGRVSFSGTAAFVESRFGDAVTFDQATFNEAWFRGARFSGDVYFTKATFGGDVDFTGATGNAQPADAAPELRSPAALAVHFDGARARTSNNSAWPEGWTSTLELGTEWSRLGEQPSPAGTKDESGSPAGHPRPG